MVNFVSNLFTQSPFNDGVVHDRTYYKLKTEPKRTMRLSGEGTVMYLDSRLPGVYNLTDELPALPFNVSLPNKLKTEILEIG